MFSHTKKSEPFFFIKPDSFAILIRGNGCQVFKSTSNFEVAECVPFSVESLATDGITCCLGIYAELVNSTKFPSVTALAHLTVLSDTNIVLEKMCFHMTKCTGLDRTAVAINFYLFGTTPESFKEFNNIQKNTVFGICAPEGCQIDLFPRLQNKPERNQQDDLIEKQSIPPSTDETVTAFDAAPSSSEESDVSSEDEAEFNLCFISLFQYKNNLLIIQEESTLMGERKHYYEQPYEFDSQLKEITPQEHATKYLSLSPINFQKRQKITTESALEPFCIFPKGNYSPPQLLHKANSKLEIVDLGFEKDKKLSI